MKQVYVGMDIGSKQCACVAIDSRGRMLDSEVFRTSEHNMVSFFEGLNGSVSVIMEEGELAIWVAGTIKPRVERVVISDPRRNAWVAKAGNKNDPLDAAKLAELLRLGSYSEVWHPENGVLAEFKLVVQRYEECSKKLARTKVQIKALFRRQGVLTKGKAVYGLQGRQAALDRIESKTVRQLIEIEYEMLDFLVLTKAKALRILKQESGKFPVIKRLKKTPGVGPVLAARFVAYVGDPNRFNKRTLASYSCLGVIKRSSDGSSIGREHLSKAGNYALKDMSRTVFERARVTKSSNGITDFYMQSLARTNNRTNARLNTQRKILAVMLAIWRDGTDYCDEMVTGRAFTGN
jgi:transposase